MSLLPGNPLDSRGTGYWKIDGGFYRELRGHLNLNFIPLAAV